MKDSMLENLLKTIADITGETDGAFNLRKDGVGVIRHSTENIEIKSKEDKPGIDIIVKPHTKGEKVHIPVVITETGVNDLVYNDFFIGEGAEVDIVAGCGIHNCGSSASEHDGIHTFYISKGAKVTYVEKHYGEGEGTGDRILNPTTIVHNLGKDAKLVVTEKLMTHDKQHATSNITANLNGKNSILQIVSRSVAKNDSTQSFHPIAVGNEKCRAHIQCDSIIMDNAKVASIPEIQANHTDAAIIHEAAIGRINNEQLLKLETFGLDEEQAEAVIVEAFLS